MQFSVPRDTTKRIQTSNGNRSARDLNSEMKARHTSHASDSDGPKGHGAGVNELRSGGALSRDRTNDCINVVDKPDKVTKRSNGPHRANHKGRVHFLYPFACVEVVEGPQINHVRPE